MPRNQSMPTGLTAHLTGLLPIPLLHRRRKSHPQAASIRASRESSIQDAVSSRSGYLHQIIRALIFVPIISLIGATIGSPSRCVADDLHSNSTVLPHREQTAPPYVVRVYFDQVAKDGSDAYYEILKDNKPVFRQKASFKGEQFFIGTMDDKDPDATLVKMGKDITGDGQPDLVISEWSGGANCCLTILIFEIGSTFRQIGMIAAKYGDTPPHFVHMDDQDSKNVGLKVQVGDWTFANWHSDFADSPAPKVILRFSDGAYRVSPDLMRSPVPSVSDLDARVAEIRTHKNTSRSKSWPGADISPTLWATMLDLIYTGHAGDAWKFLDRAWPPQITGKDAFARDFRAPTKAKPLLVLSRHNERVRSPNRQQRPNPATLPIRYAPLRQLVRSRETTAGTASRSEAGTGSLSPHPIFIVI